MSPSQHHRTHVVGVSCGFPIHGPGFTNQSRNWPAILWGPHWESAGCSHFRGPTDFFPPSTNHNGPSRWLHQVCSYLFLLPSFDSLRSGSCAYPRASENTEIIFSPSRASSFLTYCSGTASHFNDKWQVTRSDAGITPSAFQYSQRGAGENNRGTHYAIPP